MSAPVKPSGPYRVKSHNGTLAGSGPLKPIPGALGRGNAPAPRAATVFAANAAAAAPEYTNVSNVCIHICIKLYPLIFVTASHS